MARERLRTVSFPEEYLFGATQHSAILVAFGDDAEAFLEQLDEDATIVRPKRSAKILPRELGISDDKLMSVVAIELGDDFRERSHVEVELSRAPGQRFLDLLHGDRLGPRRLRCGICVQP